VLISDRLRSLREEKKLSQGDIEKRTGLLRCYVSRVENGHTVPAVETIEKFARALEVPIYQIRKGSPAVLGRERNSATAAPPKQANSTARMTSPISAAAKATRNPFLRY